MKAVLMMVGALALSQVSLASVAPVKHQMPKVFSLPNAGAPANEPVPVPVPDPSTSNAGDNNGLGGGNSGGA